MIIIIYIRHNHHRADSTEFFDSLFGHQSLSLIDFDGSSWRIQYPRTAYEYKSLLVGQHWCVHVLAPTAELRWWVCPCFSSSAQRVFFVLIGWFVRWEASCCITSFVGCCFQDLFKTTRSILVLFPSSFFFKHFLKILVVQLNSSTCTATTSIFTRKIRFPCPYLSYAYAYIAFSR